MHRTAVLIQPIQGFLDEFVTRDYVATLIEQALLLLGAEQLVERLLGGFNGEEKVIFAVQHQRGLLDAAGS